MPKKNIDHFRPRNCSHSLVSIGLVSSPPDTRILPGVGCMASAKCILWYFRGIAQDVVVLRLAREAGHLVARDILPSDQGNEVIRPYEPSVTVPFAD